MNLLIGAPLWLVWILVLALLAGAIEDALRLRISNITALVVLCSAIGAAALQGFPLSLWQNVVVFCIILALGTGAFAAGLLGGGDVKLLAASAIWLDGRSAVWLIALVFLSGGLLAIFYLVSRLWRSRRDSRIPYGIAIAIGTVAVIAMSRGFLEHHDRPLPQLKIARPSA